MSETQFTLPGGYVYVENGVELFRSNNAIDTTKPLKRVSDEGNFPNTWKIVEGSSKKLEECLKTPIADASVVLDENGNASIMVACTIDIGKDILTADLTTVVYKYAGVEENKIYVVVCYSDGGVEPTNPEPRNIFFSIPSCGAEGAEEGDFDLELYLFEEDPKTARGTVTTVLHRWPEIAEDHKAEEMA